MADASLTEMVRYVNNLIYRYGEPWIHRYIDDAYSGGNACCCMGPYDGYSVCPCAMESAIHANKVKILNEIDPELALFVLRKNIVKALK